MRRCGFFFNVAAANVYAGESWHFDFFGASKAILKMTLDYAVLAGAGIIFLARVVDVYTIRGQRLPSVALGFVESLVFIAAISGVLAGEMSVPKMLGYAAGFACGIWIGLTIESWIASGWWVVRIIGRDDSQALLARLRSDGHAVTAMTGEGRDGPVPILLTVVQRRKAKEVMAVVRQMSPHAFVTVESAGAVINGHASAGKALSLRTGFHRGLRPGPVLVAAHPFEPPNGAKVETVALTSPPATPSANHEVATVSPPHQRKME